MLLFMLARFASCLDSPSHRLAFTTCVMVLLILLGALTVELLQLQLTSRPCSDRLSQWVATLTGRFHSSGQVLISAHETNASTRMGYREATTHIQLWLLGALISHSEFDVVDFLICEIEDTVLDGLHAW
jgi:hypothetical protein